MGFVEMAGGRFNWNLDYIPIIISIQVKGIGLGWERKVEFELTPSILQSTLFD